MSEWRISTLKTFRKPLSYRDRKLFNLIRARVKEKGFANSSEIFRLGLIYNLYKTSYGYRAILKRLRLRGMIRITQDGKIIIPEKPEIERGDEIDEIQTSKDY